MVRKQFVRKQCMNHGNKPTIILKVLILTCVLFTSLTEGGERKHNGFFDFLFAQKSSKESVFHPYYKSNNQYEELWDRIRDNFGFNLSNDHQQVKHFIQIMSAEEKTLVRHSVKAKPYLYYIVEQLEKRNMPSELALLPMIESAFEPEASSHKGAAGLWQFIPGTGRRYGLKQDSWYDGRRDIAASTKAALDYLSFLHEEFDHNWMLALAAYNAGEGAVHKAINRNKRAGKSISFWSLPLPKETRQYVPKLLALAEIVKNPEKHDISLPKIENKPYFTPVNPGEHLDFKEVAKLAKLNIKEIKRLNPGYRKQKTHPKGPQGLLLPIPNAIIFEKNLANNDKD